MKYLLCLLFAAFTHPLFAEGEYILRLDGKPVEVSLGERQTLTLTNGQKVTVLLTKKDVITFQGKTFSFKHKSEYNPSRTELGVGIRQTLLTSAVGTGIIVQEYGTLDPSGLIELMVKQLTKEEVLAGYKLEEKAIEKKLADGTVMKGKVATTTLRNQQWVRSVLAHGNDNGGTLVVTFVEKENLEKEQSILDMFWQSLILKDN